MRPTLVLASIILAALFVSSTQISVPTAPTDDHGWCGPYPDELADRLHDPGASDSLGGVGPLCSDQLMVPAHDRVRRHDGRDLGEKPASESLALGCETTALVVGQAESLAPELLLEDAVLLGEVIDSLSLAVVHPSAEGGQEELKGEEVGHDAVIVPVRRKVVSRSGAVRSTFRTLRA